MDKFMYLHCRGGTLRDVMWDLERIASVRITMIEINLTYCTKVWKLSAKTPISGQQVIAEPMGLPLLGISTRSIHKIPVLCPHSSRTGLIHLYCIAHIANLPALPIAYRVLLDPTTIAQFPYRTYLSISFRVACL